MGVPHDERRIRPDHAPVQHQRDRHEVVIAAEFPLSDHGRGEHLHSVELVR